jgi:excisionase family DNA binding protein
MPKPPADWISLSEAAELLAASNVHFRADTIGRWARAGQLQSIKLGNRRFVRRAQVRSLLRPHGVVHGEDLQPGLFEELDD